MNGLATRPSMLLVNKRAEYITTQFLRDGRFEGTQLVLISNTQWVGEQVPCLTYGMRGMISLSIEASTGPLVLGSLTAHAPALTLTLALTPRSILPYVGFSPSPQTVILTPT